MEDFEPVVLTGFLSQIKTRSHFKKISLPSRIKEPTSLTNRKKEPTSLTNRKKEPTSVFFVVVLLFNSILLCSFAGLAIKWHFKRSAANKPRASDMCVPSTEFHNNTCPASVKTENNQCCGKVSDLIDALLSKSIEKTFAEHYPSRLFSGDNLFCAKTTRQQSIFSANGLATNETLTHDENEALKWRKQESTPASTSSLFIYHHGKVYVTTTGKYFVFSQIQLGYRPTQPMTLTVDPSAENGRSVTYYHRIIHFSYKQQREKVILENTRHHCIRQQNKTCSMTMSTAAVIYLEERDHVYVVTSHPSHIIQSADNNRFSVLHIPSKGAWP